MLVLWWVGITAAFVFFVHLSRYGNWIFAIGGDSVSARNAGIPTGRITILLFMLSSVCASFVGMSQAILFQSVQATPQLTLIFNTIGYFAFLYITFLLLTWTPKYLQDQFKFELSSLSYLGLPTNCTSS